MINQLLARIKDALFKSDPETTLEMMYHELQSNLVSVREAVAKEIVTEKLLEAKLESFLDQTSKHPDAQKRSTEENDLRGRLKTQQETTRSSRERLTRLEGLVQRLYNLKCIMVAWNAFDVALPLVTQYLKLGDAVRRLEEITFKVQRQRNKSGIQQESNIDKLGAQLKSQQDIVARMEDELNKTERETQAAYSAELLTRVEQARQAGPVAVRELENRVQATSDSLAQIAKKNADQAATWQLRVNLASQQGDEKLAAQALRTRDLYEHEAQKFNDSIKIQAEAHAMLVRAVAEVEGTRGADS